MRIVEVGNSVSERLDTSSRSVLASSHGDINVGWAIKAAFDVVVDFGRSLSQVCPRVRILEVSVFVGLLGGPDDTSAGTGRVETSVRFVTFMGSTELPVNGRFELLGVIWSAFASLCLVLQLKASDGHGWRRRTRYVGMTE